MPSTSHTDNTDINYLACQPKHRDNTFDDDYRGTVLIDRPLNAMICHFQHHSIHNGIVPRPFDEYLLVDDDGDYIYGSRTI
eukprot:523540-Ditylum_brightwellii.AAC.1